jgi:uncharacterized membrane protein YraQ (UPF0718 family)
MKTQAIETAEKAAGWMTFSPLEFALLSLVFTVIGGIIVGIVVRYLSANRFMTRVECQEKHANDCRFNQDLHKKIEDLQRQQEKFQEAVAERNHILFRMLRGLVVYSDISAENKERILNERGRDLG